MGKSTLAKPLLVDFVKRYVQKRPKKKQGRVLVLDTKPRWRGTRRVTGPSIRKRYKDYVQGDTLDATVISSIKEWDLAWSQQLNPSQTVIVQVYDDRDPIPLMIHAMRKFFASTKPGREDLVYIDEGMDFFGPSGTGRYSNIVQRIVRAGGEKGVASLIGVQRPKTINLQLLTESNTCYLFHIAFDEDMKRLREMGWPKNVGAPKDRYDFLFFRDNELYDRPLKLGKV